MKAFRIAAATLALGTSIVIAPGVASAHKKHPGNNQAKPASKAPHTTKYIFRGVVVATPAAGATSVQVEVRSGNKAGLDLNGPNATVQTFNFGAGSQVFTWNAAGTAATSVAATNLLAGDPVAVTIWGPSRTTMAQLLLQPVNRVDDVLNSSKPAGRMFIFGGNVVSTDPTTGALTINVTTGNWRALRALTGMSMTETFHYGLPSTTFLNFNGKGKAHLMVAPTFTAGQFVTIRVFSANYDSSPTTLLNSAAWRINLHEPKAMLHADIKKHNDHHM